MIELSDLQLQNCCRWIHYRTIKFPGCSFLLAFDRPSSASEFVRYFKDKYSEICNYQANNRALIFNNDSYAIVIYGIQETCGVAVDFVLAFMPKGTELDHYLYMNQRRDMGLTEYFGKDGVFCYAEDLI